MTIDEVRHAPTGPVLADGTPLSELIDREYREVSLRVLNDPELYQLELKHLFAKAWTVVAHEDEIPNAGDYILRYVGEDQVIVSRQKDGSVTVALNVCSHRAIRVCRFEAGNATQFQCPYHGWTYKSDGTFLASPIARENMHGSLRSNKELSLLQGRAEIYAGMVFATFDEKAPVLRDYLGPMVWYYDLMFARTRNGMTVLGHPQRFIIPANWKSAAEQFAGDLVHILTLHRSMQELELISQQGAPNKEPAMPGVSSSFNGHFVRCFDLGEEHFVNSLKGKNLTQMSPIERMRLAPPPGMSVDMVEDLPQRFDEGQLEVLSMFTPTVGQLFPNVAVIAMPLQFPDGTPSAFFSWRVWLPKGPDHFELISWTLVERDAPKELVESMKLMTNTSFGISGFVETDDTDTWPLQSKSARGALGQQSKLRYQAIRGENKPAGWPGPGQIFAGFGKDDPQWNFWLRYTEFMEGRPW
jgi:phenylpropionate dioxygenase-like ring-hydroxylating dioxygenase large terminal subunit